MKLSLKAMAIAIALLWGGCIFFFGVVNLAAPSYGMEVLRAASSIYPGFHASRTFADVLVGTGYALVDGGIGGFLIAWLYNLFTRSAS